MNVSPLPVWESPQVSWASQSTRFPSEYLSRGRDSRACQGDTPPGSPARPRARIHYKSHSPSPRPEGSVAVGVNPIPWRNPVVNRGSIAQVASPVASSRGLMPGGIDYPANSLPFQGPPRQTQAQAPSPSIISSPSAPRQQVESVKMKKQEAAKGRCRSVQKIAAVQPPPACSTRWVQEPGAHPQGGRFQSPPRTEGRVLYQAANSEDMEGRSIDGSASIALAAFGRELPEVTSKVQAVSLGGSCGPKISLRRLGLGEATMPFDWMRTRVDAIIHWLRNGFDDFLNTRQRLEVNYQDTAMTVYRSPNHSFWHDDLQDEVCREKLRRRVDRFLALAPATSKEVATDVRDLLFVRGVAGSSEMEGTEELFIALTQRFEGRRVWLLLVLEDQPILGPVMSSGHDRLIIWVQPRFEGKVSTDVGVPSPYEDAIAFTVRHILGDRGGLYPGEDVEEWPVIDKVTEILTPGSTFWNAGCRPTEVGLWVGHVRVGSSKSEVLMSAFQGFDHVDGHAPQGAFQALRTSGREPLPVHPVTTRDNRIQPQIIFGLAPGVAQSSRETTPARNMVLNYAVVAAH